jgi:hypothetical protein
MSSLRESPSSPAASGTTVPAPAPGRSSNVMRSVSLRVLNSARSRSRLSADCQQGGAIYWEMRVATLGLLAAKFGKMVAGAGGSNATPKASWLR